MDHQQQAEGYAGPGVRASIERGQRGGIGWKLGLTLPPPAEGADYDAQFGAAIDALKKADDRMKREFGGAVEA